jgi:hypothetical protein
MKPTIADRHSLGLVVTNLDRDYGIGLAYSIGF